MDRLFFVCFFFSVNPHGDASKLDQSKHSIARSCIYVSLCYKHWYVSPLSPICQKIPPNWAKRTALKIPFYFRTESSVNRSRPGSVQPETVKSTPTHRHTRINDTLSICSLTPPPRREYITFDYLALYFLPLYRHDIVFCECNRCVTTFSLPHLSLLPDPQEEKRWRVSEHLNPRLLLFTDSKSQKK